MGWHAEPLAQTKKEFNKNPIIIKYFLFIESPYSFIRRYLIFVNRAVEKPQFLNRFPLKIIFLIALFGNLRFATQQPSQNLKFPNSFRAQCGAICGRI
jgi:hypothetical protein